MPSKSTKLSDNLVVNNCVSATYDALLLAKEFARMTTKAAVKGKPVKHAISSCMRELVSSVKL